MISLDPLHPKFRDGMPKILAAMAALGFPMILTQGLRTNAQQEALYAQGRTAPGPVVTRDDGEIHKSPHQEQSDGFGHAVDCAFLVNGQASWDLHLPWATYGACGKALGFKWGGDWITFPDRPHLEL